MRTLKQISTQKAVQNGNQIDIIERGFEIGDLKYKDETLYSIPLENKDDLFAIFDRFEEDNRIKVNEAL